MASTSEWKKDERLKPSTKPSQGNILDLRISASLTDRRIYLFFDTKTTGAGVVVIESHVEYSLGDEIRGIIPCTIADFNGNNFNQSYASLLNSGGTPVGDSLVLVVGQQLDAGVAEPVIQPLRINGQFDKLSFIIDTVRDDSNVLSGYHIYLACFSSKI